MTQQLMIQIATSSTFGPEIRRYHYHVLNVLLRHFSLNILKDKKQCGKRSNIHLVLINPPVIHSWLFMQFSSVLPWVRSNKENKKTLFAKMKIEIKQLLAS